MYCNSSWVIKLRLRLYVIVYVQIRLGSDPLWYRLTVYTGPVQNWNGMVPYGITSISGSIWWQIANLIRTGSTRSHVNTRLIRTNFVLVSKDPVPCNCSLKNAFILEPRFVTVMIKCNSYVTRNSCRLTKYFGCAILHRFLSYNCPSLCSDVTVEVFILKS